MSTPQRAEPKGRSKREADRHYQNMADAEVARIRASVPDSPSPLKALGTCEFCGKDVTRIISQWTHIEQPADHPAALLHEVKR